MHQAYISYTFNPLFNKAAGNKMGLYTLINYKFTINYRLVLPLTWLLCRIGPGCKSVQLFISPPAKAVDERNMRAGLKVSNSTSVRCCKMDGQKEA